VASRFIKIRDLLSGYLPAWGAARPPGPPWEAAARLAAWAAILTAVAVVMAPWWKDTSTFGFHDWDVQTAHRELVRMSLLEHGEMPWWNPYLCGGYPAWGYVEAGTIVVSPFLPFYLLLPMSLALRVEVTGYALLGALGAYAAAGRFTRSHAARALVVVLWAVNGRWALQTASGHTWHLAYAWMPWCLYFFERARALGPRVRDIAGLGGSFAMLVYSGGIYPLPHTVLALGLYAMALTLIERSARPLVTLGVGGLFGVGLAAPKLLPMLDTFKKAPRIIESNETMDLGALVTMLTSRDQSFSSRPARVPAWGWHEWGIYISPVGLAILAIAALVVQGRRELALKLTGAAFLVLGFGAFHPSAPWKLLHTHAPVFSSQHVPSRFLYGAVLLFALVAAAGIGRAIERRGITRPWLDFAAALAVLAIGFDVAQVAQLPMAATMWMVPPAVPADRAFHFEQEAPFHYKKRDWAGPMYLAMLGNTGVLNCYGAPPFDRKGALAQKDPRYRGEVHVQGQGTPRLTAWSPNTAVVDVEGAAEGALLVYNMNYDEGWHATIEGPDETRAVSASNVSNRTAARLPPGSSRVTFWYRPPNLGIGLGIGALAALTLLGLRRRERRIDQGIVA
jgi:hypothetical protein